MVIISWSLGRSSVLNFWWCLNVNLTVTLKASNSQGEAWILPCLIIPSMLHFQFVWCDMSWLGFRNCEHSPSPLRAAYFPSITLVYCDVREWRSATRNNFTVLWLSAVEIAEIRTGPSLSYIQVYPWVTEPGSAYSQTRKKLNTWQTSGQWGYTECGVAIFPSG